MFEHLKKYLVVLASNSPRRKSLLSELGIPFESINSQGDENYPATLDVHQVPEFLATQKANYFQNFDKNQLYITADTVVILQNKILEKPTNLAHAQEMISQLSGHTSKVITGVCLKSKNKQLSFSCTTQVTFVALTPEEIAHYVHQYQPLDKAGAYGIQEWIGLMGISQITGSYPNVVGLPTHALYAHLKAF